MDNRTDENTIGTSYGIYRAGTIKGVPEDRRLSATKALEVIGMPWDPTPNVDTEDGALVPNAGAADGEVIPKNPEFP